MLADTSLQVQHPISAVVTFDSENWVQRTGSTSAVEVVCICQVGLTLISRHSSEVIGAVIDEDLSSSVNILKSVYRESLCPRIPREVCVRYARMIEPGRLQEDSVSFCAVSVCSHTETIRFEARLRFFPPRGRLLNGAYEGPELLIICVAPCDSIFIEHTEMGPLRDNRSATGNIPCSPDPPTSKSRIELFE